MEKIFLAHSSHFTYFHVCITFIAKCILYVILKISFQIFPENKNEKIMLKLVLVFLSRILQNPFKINELND